MKKKIIYISCFVVYLIIITIIGINFNKKLYKSTESLKQHFCDDFNEQFDKEYASYDYFIVVGNYKRGYLLVDYNYNLQTESDWEPSSTSITIDGIEINTFKETEFYFYTGRKITCGLENIYDKKLISKKELQEIKDYIDSFSNNNYIVTDYFIE